MTHEMSQMFLPIDIVQYFHLKPIQGRKLFAEIQYALDTTNIMSMYIPRYEARNVHDE